MSVQYLHRLLRTTHYYRVSGRSCLISHFFLPLPQFINTILREVAVNNKNIQPPDIAQPWCGQDRKCRFADTAFLIGEWNGNRFFIHILWFWFFLFISSASRRTPHLVGPRVSSDPAFSRTPQWNPLEPGTNKRAEPAKRYQQGHEAPWIALIDPYHER